jgi:stage IV sporulation protein FB
MENTPEPIDLSPGSSPRPEEQGLIYPAKPPAEEPRSTANVWLRSLTSLVLYFLIGYYFFNQNWTLVLVLTGVVVFHELGHFLAMKFYDYTDLGIFFIPLVGAYASGKKQDVSQWQSSIILLAGPVPGIIVGILLQFTAIHFTTDIDTLVLLHRISWILIYLNLFNLLPVYPLDGGQLLNRLFLDSSRMIGKIFVLLSIAGMTWFALEGTGRPIYALLLLPAFLLSRMLTDVRYDRLTKKVEAEGLDLDTSYEDIPDEKYWQIRNAIIRHHAPFKDVDTAPPYHYSPREDQIKTMMQNLLQRTITQDISIGGKILIIVIWLACFAVPYIVGLPLRVF